MFCIDFFLLPWFFTYTCHRFLSNCKQCKEFPFTSITRLISIRSVTGLAPKHCRSQSFRYNGLIVLSGDCSAMTSVGHKYKHRYIKVNIAHCNHRRVNINIQYLVEIIKIIRMLTYIQSLGTTFTHTHVKECSGNLKYRKNCHRSRGMNIQYDPYPVTKKLNAEKYRIEQTETLIMPSIIFKPLYV